MAVTFDTLKASRRLQDAGFDEEKADALVSIFAGEIGASLSTKDDVAAVRTDLGREIAAVRVEMKQMEERLDQKIAAVRTDSAHETAVLRAEMREMEERLTNRMYKTTAWSAGLMLTALGIVTAIILAAG
ncbi:MAG: hypothetical protein OXG22_12190 [Chloroflexi bacterium]|nr:hypothetical protein [Chloroflexota bacterium]